MDRVLYVGSGVTGSVAPTKLGSRRLFVASSRSTSEYLTAKDLLSKS